MNLISVRLMLLGSHNISAEGCDDATNTIAHNISTVRLFE